MKKTIIISLVMLMVLAFSQGLLAGETINVATGDFEPWMGEDLVHNGFVAHIITEAFAEEGYEVEIDFMPWERAYNAALAGRYDASGHWYPSEERAEENYYSDYVNREQMVFFYKGDDPIEGWEELEDLTDVNIGATRGYTYTDEFWGLGEEGVIEVEEANTDYQNFQKLLNNRIDVFISMVVAGENVLNEEFSSEEIADVSYTEDVVQELTGHLLFPREHENSERYLETFNRGLNQLKEDGRYDEYYQDLLEGGYELEEE